jgi:glutamate N-acetyltransferase/amino-acid N-acetyltransferase
MTTLPLAAHGTDAPAGVASELQPARGGVTAPGGFVAGAATAGLRSHRAPDLALVASDDGPLAAAAVFTTNRFVAAPVSVAREMLERGGGLVDGVVVNAGCANAGTGAPGIEDAHRVAAAADHRLGGATGAVLPASTGLIGSRLAVDRIEAALPRLRLSATPRAAGAAARAIMTTDTRPKQAAARAALPGGGWLTVGGMAKGAGMIHPQMATMLAFLTTDAAASPATLRSLLADAADATFNQVTIDGDGSTNDAVFLLASGRAAAPAAEDDGATLPALSAAVTAVCRSLAQQIAADGEGARRRIDVLVGGARHDADARLAARAVAASNLVKAAVHGADPNWGRIAAAAGRSGAEFDPARLAIRIGDTAVFAGEPLPFDERAVSRTLRGRVVRLALHLGIGTGSGEAWGCDLSAEYVAINSEYRT